MIQALATGWLAKKLMILPKWLLLGIGAILLAKWVLIRGHKKGTD